MKKRSVWILALILALLLGGCSSDFLASVPNPVATVTMSDGKTLRFELFLQDAPNTVANFVELANSGFYDGLEVFRVVPGALVQTGDPRNDGTGGAGYTIQGEFSANGIGNAISHERGTISMSRQSKYDTASSQFFILVSSVPEYDGQYAAFGRAMDQDSLNALDELAGVPVDGSFTPVGNRPKIRSIRVETYGYSYTSAKIDLSAEDAA